ncbi:formylmethanofuran--tetrahydromethanopterin N-formyltransferase [Aurantimonas endophytica]|uniref:Formylmethanofuran--tetrahydromethanopterin formyltransferase n=1 Tax=Aurantimonas endophytica TaxID=1522175 RepID=A0A7W6MPX0_9HYPH|nr:formylmethanofuran--tetrahydromethanopterin N-formyltransferase [Aurantimonas endophytica]MBB4003332.1 formylmethanofuran--tetrahydromethanopterin N-formyltransferase [Aurantimonas endophytica]MCO6404193.1 formylmethanofuran--tetrahydromethanopterin N-formyltransferase [Aurantimonas endophytica]
MPDMNTAATINGVVIDDTFAEAFPMSGTAIQVTADSEKWALEAARSFTGFATSVIACGCEAGIDRIVPPEESRDGRPGMRILLFSMDRAGVVKQLGTRLGQCILTSPSSACYADLAGESEIDLGSAIRYFADGWQISKKFGDKHFWRMPVMEGEFLCEAKTGITSQGVGGGNLLFLARGSRQALAAAEAAVEAMRAVPDVIMPFPGGIVRSGSKVGGKYKGMMASTNDAYCPTLKGVTPSALGPEIGSVLEIVIDGLSADAVAEAMRAGLKAAVDLGPDEGALRIGAGNYGGNLGPHHFHLKDILP